MTDQVQTGQRPWAFVKVLLWLWILAVFAIYMQNYFAPIRLIVRAVFG